MAPRDVRSELALPEELRGGWQILAWMLAGGLGVLLWFLGLEIAEQLITWVDRSVDGQAPAWLGLGSAAALLAHGLALGWLVRKRLAPATAGREGPYRTQGGEEAPSPPTEGPPAAPFWAAPLVGAPLYFYLAGWHQQRHEAGFEHTPARLLGLWLVLVLSAAALWWLLRRAGRLALRGGTAQG